MQRPVALLMLVSLSACEEIRTITFGPEDGVQPVWYTDTFYRLPVSYDPEEIPDGRYFIESYSGGVTLEVDTLGDGSRSVAFIREASLMDATTSAFYRDTIGADAIEGINGLELELRDLAVEDVDMVRCRPEVFAAGGHLDDLGSTLSVDHSTLSRIRERLLAGEAISIPFELRFVLTPADFDVLPSRLHLFVEVQPTIYVDSLDAL